MAVDFEREPDYEALFGALLAKTKEGKIQWQGTAEENKFIAAIKGQRTFEIAPAESHIEWHPSVALLRVCDAQGRLLFTTPASAGCAELYRLARRVALRMDDQLQATVELLKDL
jgi:hypothetical protein